MGIRVIGQKKFEVTETELLQQDLLFYLDNPRVYSVLHENGHDNPTQTEIEEIMCSLDHVKSLKSQIMQNGGLIEPLIVVKRKDRYVVLEGNSRLAAYRILAKNDPLKWSRVLVQILPEDISDSDIFTLLGTFHLNPKKDWSKFEQAAYIYRQKKELGCSDSALGKQVGISAITVKKYCEIYGLMVEHNDTHQSHWNMYEQYVQNKGIKQYRNTYPEMDSFFAKQVKTGEIVRAQDVRDILGKIASDAKYLRALQCMLIPTQGKGIQGRSFFEADFGKTAEDFVMYLAMPERLLNKRGHFVERKDEPKFEREIRYTQWSENRHLIDTWMKYYSMFEKDTVLEYIGCNRFSVETLDKIENEELKKLYFLYLTPSATIRVFSDCTEDTKRIISTFISEELPFMYSRIVETILSSKPGYKVIAGILENFGEKVCTDLLKKIDLFSGHDNDKLTMLIKANKSKRLVDFDFSLLQFIPYFHVSNLLSKQEEQIIMNSAYRSAQ